MPIYVRYTCTFSAKLIYDCCWFRFCSDLCIFFVLSIPMHFYLLFYFIYFSYGFYDRSIGTNVHIPIYICIYYICGVDMLQRLHLKNVHCCICFHVMKTKCAYSIIMVESNCTWVLYHFFFFLLFSCIAFVSHKMYKYLHYLSHLLKIDWMNR